MSNISIGQIIIIVLISILLFGDLPKLLKFFKSYGDSNISSKKKDYKN